MAIKGLFFCHPSLSLLPLKGSTESTLDAESQDMLHPVQLSGTAAIALPLQNGWFHRLPAS